MRRVLFVPFVLVAAPLVGVDAHAATTAVAIVATPTGNGAWVASRDGTVAVQGDAPQLGSARSSAPGVGMAGTPSGKGYWLVTSVGGVFAFGDAPGKGSAVGLRLNRPIV